MTPISKELQEQIEREAEAIYPIDNRYDTGGAVTGVYDANKAQRKIYIAGATAYAHYKECWDQAKKALEDQAAYLQKKIKGYTGLLLQVEDRLLKATVEEDWFEEKECKVLKTVWGTNVKLWTETLTGIEALLASWKEEGKEGGV